MKSDLIYSPSCGVSSTTVANLWVPDSVRKTVSEIMWKAIEGIIEEHQLLASMPAHAGEYLRIHSCTRHMHVRVHTHTE